MQAKQYKYKELNYDMPLHIKKLTYSQFKFTLYF